MANNKFVNIGSSFKIDRELLEIKEELENKIKEKVSLFPSFQVIRIDSGIDGNDFISDKYTIRIFYKQENCN